MRPGNPVRLALLGAWHVHADDHARSAVRSSAAELVAVWDHDLARARAAAERWRVPVCDDLDALLADGAIDGVVVASETARHEALIGAALRAGRHVFCEKALAASGAAAGRLRSLAFEAGVTLGVALPRLYRGYTRALARLLQSGALGDVVAARIGIGHDGARATASHPQGWLTPDFFRAADAEGGVLIDLGAHPLYLALHLFGEPSTVRASLGFATGREVEDHAVAALRHASGLVVSCEASFLVPYRFGIEIVGSQGHFAYEETRDGRGYRHSLPQRWPELHLEFDEREPFDVWVEAVQAGVPQDEQTALAVQLARLTEIAYASHGRDEELRLV